MDGFLHEPLEKLSLHDHIGLFARDTAEKLSVLIPFIRIGLARGEKCLLYCDRAAGEEILSGLRSKGIDIGSALARGSVLVSHEEAAQWQKGVFDPDALVAHFLSASRLAASEKFTGLRLCVDMKVILVKGVERERHLDYQWKLHTFLSETKSLCLCIHGLEDFSADMLLDGLRAHRHMIVDGKIMENCYFVPPAADSARIEGSRLLRQRLVHLDERHEQIERLLRQAVRLTRLRDITSSLLSHAALPDLLSRIVGGVVALGYRMCWIGMAKADGAVEPVASCGDKKGCLLETPVRWDDTPYGNGPTGTAIRTGKPSIVRDVIRSQRFAPWRESTISQGYHSVVSLPLREERSVIGALTVHATDRYAFDREAMEELAAFAQQASLVLQRAREYRRLSLSEERLRTLFEQIPAACFTYDHEGVIRHWNLHCRRLFGFSPKDAIGKSLYQLHVGPGDEGKTKEILSRVFQGESFFNLEWESRPPEGESLWILTNTYPFRGKKDDVEMAISVNIDISGQVRARRALAESEERFRAVVENTNVVVVELDPEGKTILINPTAERLTGYRAKEVLGRDYFSLFLPEKDRKRTTDVFHKILGGQEAEGFVNAIRNKDGSERILSWHAKALRNARGEVSGVVWLGVDITERFQAEREREELSRKLAQAQKMEAVGMIAGGIAHEFNNILGAIIGNCGLLETRMDPASPHIGTVRKIQASAERAADLTQKLVGFARHGKYLVRPVSFNDIVSHSLPLLAKDFSPSIEIRTVLDISPIVVEGDEGQLQRCLLNLCFNARDAMPDGGTMTIRTGSARLTALEAKRYHVEGPGTYAFIEVGDTGEGISEEVGKRIFEPFFTTRQDKGRAGMGLPMVYGIVKNHRGGIHVESVPGGGTLFRIYMPEAARMDVAAETSPAGVHPGGSETILIVDDEPDIRDMGAQLLSALGYRTIAAEDGEAACRLFQERGREIGLVLLDIVMPRMGGRETFRTLRRMDPGLPVLLSSGYAVEGLAQDILDEGANGFIQKPYRLSELARTIRRILDATVSSGQAGSGA